MGRFKKIIFVVTAFYIVTFSLFLFTFASLYDAPSPSRTFLDRRGKVIGTLNPAFSGMQRWVSLSDIPQTILEKTVSKEDRLFYWHRGVNPWALLKALGANLFRAGGPRRGGSTITQQLAKNLIQDKNCRKGDCRPLARTWTQKIREMTLALGLELKHSKSWILERYLNTVYYGNRCYGIGAASRFYFGKDPNSLELDDGEIDILISLPQAPERRSKRLISSLKMSRPSIGRHFMESFSKEGSVANVVRTTLDLETQTKTELGLQDALRDRAEKDPKLTAAAVVIDVRSGDVLAMVGSRDYFDETIDGQVNGAMALRQPGSTLKPFTYFAAFTQGFSPESRIQDQPTSFHVPALTEESASYMPQNFDRRFHGMVTIREALANSYNVPAVVTLNDIGLSYYHETLRRFGLTSLNRSPTYYGLAITLGSAEVSLMELTNAYAALARGGRFLPYRMRPEVPVTSPLPVHPQAMKAALLTTSILTDAEARRKSFGFNDDLAVEGFDVAVKTGTSYDHRDNWTVGYTPSYAVGVWVGHADGTPLELTTGATGAAPVWHKIMEALLRGTFPERFPRPQPSLEASSLKPELVAEDSRSWKVVSPLPYARYREHAYLPTDHQGLKLEAKARNPRERLSWYLDGVLLETTTSRHELFAAPTLGRHVLTVVSDSHEKETIPFFVLEDFKGDAPGDL